MTSQLGVKHSLSELGGGMGLGSQMSLNGLTMASSSENLFHPGQPSPSHHDEMGGDPKRRRIAKACDMCRKKKIKCDGKSPKCGHCVSSKSECVFTRTEKKRNPPKGAKYIESLENRLIRMEKVLKLSGVVPEIEDGKTDLGELEKRLSERKQRESMGSEATSPTGTAVGSPSDNTGRMTPGTSTQQSSAGTPKNDNEVEVLSDMMCSLVTTCGGQTRFLGSSTAFSIFSPRGMQWLAEKVGDDQFRESLKKMLQVSSRWFPPDVENVFTSRHIDRTPLPAKEIVFSLVEDYFTFFNVLMPVHDRGTFMQMLEKQYSPEPPRKASWYCALNMVLAIACRLRITHGEAISKAHTMHNIEQSRVFYKNACSVLLQVMMTSSDLLAIQAMLCMSMYLQGSSNPHTGYMLIATAARLCSTIGMHRKGTFFQLDPVEAVQRQRVFWAIYVMDKDISLRAGRPSVINDDDISLELPDEDSPDGSGVVELKDGKKVNLFRHFVRFSQISSKVYLRLYSATAAKQSDGELLNTIGALDEELEDWRVTVPEDVRPGCGINLPTGPLVLPVVMMHFSYFNCLTTIHRMSIHHGYWTNRLSDFAIQGLNPSPLNPRVFLSAQICVNAARDSLNLTKHVQLSDYPCNWMILYFPMASFITLFSNILQNPHEPRARSDFVLMRSVEEFVLHLSTDEEDVESIHRMKVFVSEFIHIAGLVLERAEKESHSRRKRRAADPAGGLGKAATAAAAAAVAGGDTTMKDAETTAGEKVRKTRMSARVEDEGTQTNRNVASPITSVTTPQGSTVPVSGADLMFDPHTSLPYTPPSNFSWLEDSPPASGLSPHLTLTSSANHQPTIPFPPESQFASQVAGSHSPLNLQSFQQPVMPPDLWQMPMTFDWDWDLGFQMGGGGDTMF